MSEIEQRVRPGGRSARVGAAVRAAAAGLVRERGPEQVTIPAVAERAGVTPSTIYRRWGDVQQLLAEVAVTHLNAPDILVDHGSLRGDLVGWAHAVIARVSGPDGAAYLRTVVNAFVDRDPREACVVNRRGQVEEIIARARARGEAVPDVSAVLDHVLGPIYYHVLFAAGPVDDAYAEALVDRVLTAESALPRTRSAPSGA